MIKEAKYCALKNERKEGTHTHKVTATIATHRKQHA